jgi:hypothetical protein
MMSAVDITVLGFATHRLVSIWAVEKIAHPLRAWCAGTRLAALTQCPLCVSIWAAGSLFLLLMYAGTVGLVIIYTLAASEVSILLQLLVQRLSFR